MTQRVFGKDGKCIFETQWPEMMYPPAIALQMAKSGYRVTMDGKPWPVRRRRWNEEKE